MAFFHKGNFIKTVSFLGFGKSNKALYEYLKKNYPALRFTIRLQGRCEDLPKEIPVFKEKDLFARLSEDVIFVSPSIRRDKCELKEKLLSSDAEFFFEKNKRDVFAVTGSDGKSTTTTLAKELLATYYEASYSIGNIGTPFTSALDYKENCSFAAELSSFQLMSFPPPSRRAVITNITPNHLDWHKSFEEYVSAKENILKKTEEPVIFLESKEDFKLFKKYRPYAIASTTLGEEEIKSYEAQTYIYIKNAAVYANGTELIKICELFRKEEYNVKNFLSAIALTYGFFDKSQLLRIGRSFTGLSHRLELVTEASGVKFYNSSIDSSPQRTLATLSAFSHPYVLILGGRTKMKNFEILRDLISKNAHALVLTGENRYEIYEKLKPISTPVYVEESLGSAVECGFSLAKGKCHLLLSPASVSYDAFSNFEERGEAFRRAAEKIKKQGL